MRIAPYVLALLAGAAVPAAGQNAPSVERRQQIELGNLRAVSGREFVLAPGEEALGDVYAMVRRARVDGTVRGDLWAMAQQLEVGGRIERDLDTTAPLVVVSGTIGSRLRAASWSVTVSGEVGADALVVARHAVFEPGALVRGSLAVYAGTALLDGLVEGPAVLAGGEVEIRGRIAGSARIRCDRLRFGPGARIDGDLDFESRGPVDIPAGAVAGKVVRRPARTGGEPVPPEELPVWRSAGFRLVLRAYLALVALVAGGLLLLFFRPTLEETLARAVTFPQLASSFGIGLVALLALLVIGLAGCLLFPLALAVWSALAALAYFGGVIGKMVVGRWLLRPFGHAPAHPFLALAAGVAAVFAIDFIPLLGTLVEFAIMVAGMGLALLQVREPRAL
jgi:cytoskeletal protein CcmA (bactofilin family)